MKKIVITRRQFRQFLLAILLILCSLAVSLVKSARKRKEAVQPDAQESTAILSGDSCEEESGTFSEQEVSRVEEISSSDTYIAVDVAGAVYFPNQVVYLPEGSRVMDAVLMAGGTLENADLSRLNTAQIVHDGERIYIPCAGEEVEESLITGSGSPSGKSADESSSGGLTNINSASKMELMELPGIGSAYADRIIQYREETGGFQSIDELMNVQGIGPGKFESLKDLICV